MNALTTIADSTMDPVFAANLAAYWIKARGTGQSRSGLIKVGINRVLRDGMQCSGSRGLTHEPSGEERRAMPQGVEMS